MGLAEDTMAKLAERHNAERVLVRDMARRYDRAATSAAKAREELEAAEAARAEVLAEWAAAPGWNGERVAECAGLTPREVADAVRSTAAATAHRSVPTPETAPGAQHATATKATAARPARRAVVFGDRGGAGDAQSVA